MDAFTKHTDRFYVRVDKDTSRSILFNGDNRQSPNAFKRYFHNYETEITLIKNE